MSSEQISHQQKIGPKIGAMMKQPTFNWGTDDKYSIMKNFKLEVINVFKSHQLLDHCT